MERLRIRNKLTRRAAGAAVAVIALLTTGACGGDDGPDIKACSDTAEILANEKNLETLDLGQSLDISSRGALVESIEANPSNLLATGNTLIRNNKELKLNLIRLSGLIGDSDILAGRADRAARGELVGANDLMCNRGDVKEPDLVYNERGQDALAETLSLLGEVPDSQLNQDVFVGASVGEQ